jgi:hypothetical protein
VNSKIQGKKPSISGSGFLYKNALKLTYEHLEHQKIFRGFACWTPGKGKEGKGGEGKGRMCPPRENPRTPFPDAIVK